MRERLIESWLDKTNEKGYQPVFCQALSAQGLTVVHSTRHTSLELGKDVIARAKNGDYHAYQLKGNPSARLTMKQWQEILPQIHALMHQPVEPPIAAEPTLAVPYLVTNGEVDEDVHAAIRGLNALAEKEGRPPLHLISRGQLLDDYISPIAKETWPPSTDLDQHILSSWAVDGQDYIDPERFHELFLVALPLDKPPEAKVTMERALLGAAIVHEICLRRFSESKNNVALALARGLFLAASYSLIEKARFKPSDFEQFRRLIWSSIVDALLNLIEEVRGAQRRYYYDRDVRLEFPYHQQRLFLLKALFSLMDLSFVKQPELFTDRGSEAGDAQKFIKEFVELKLNPGFLVGEYAVVQFLFVYWFISTNSGRGSYDAMLAHVLESLLTQNSQADISQQIPSPYYLMPDVLERRLGVTTSKKEWKESFRNQVWTALPLFGLLVRRNLKQLAKAAFPGMTKFIHRETVIPHIWPFGLYRAEAAEDRGERLEFPAEWSTYVERTRSKLVPVPQGLREDILTLGLFLIACPFRLTEHVAYHIDEMILGNWHS